MLVEDFMLKSKYEINTKILESNEKYLNEGLLKTDIEQFLHKQGFLKYPLRGKQLNDDLRKEDFYKKQINLHKTINNILNDIKYERIG
jgi:hypothetical protein